MPPKKQDTSAFGKTLIKWYNANKRELPWRNTKDPYLIWLSEIILQQTRVDQGMPYYLAFAKNFPDVKSLAKADENKVLKLWQGLGYYSRARNLHTTAKQVTELHKGKFPADYNELLKLKGVGAYTAAAIASLAFELPHAVVDGNVYRLLSRYFGIKDAIDSTEGKKKFAKLADQLIDEKNPGTYNQAVMEFGAIQCKPVNPDCMVCPLQNSCYAFAEKQIDKLPVKAKKTAVRARHFNYLVIQYKNTVYLNQRTEKDIWKGLYDFPLIETKDKASETEILSSPELKTMVENTKFHVRSVSKFYKHILSHQHLHARFLELQIEKPLKNKSLIKVNLNELENYALPRLVERYINERQLQTIQI
ncbi:MAG: Adenine DNA glycosylase [Bacteroidia bacterium]|nr:Adenine DNA glycosylase [Bacteroidia bacterium]